MGNVLCKIRVLDGSETITYYAVWNNTVDKVVDDYPLFDTRAVGETYMELMRKYPKFKVDLNPDAYHSIVADDILKWCMKNLVKE